VASTMNKSMNAAINLLIISLHFIVKSSLFMQQKSSHQLIIADAYPLFEILYRTNLYE
jgi:hypothetical protein